MFVLADILLVAWALSAHQTTPPTVAPDAPGQATASTPPQSSADPAVRPRRLLAALDADTAWRGTTGECPTDSPTLEITTDAGENWNVSDLNGPTDSAGLVRLNVATETVATGIALEAEDCKPQFVQTYVAGEDWDTVDERTGNTWYLLPSGTVHSPRGDQSTPCKTVVALAPRDANTAAILCSDHAVHRTTNGGDSWSDPVDVPGAAAIAVSGDDYVAAVTDDTSCEGVQLFALGDDGVKASGKCHTAKFKSGDLALAQGTGTLWLWAGDDLARTDDGGATWR